MRTAHTVQRGCLIRMDSFSRLFIRWLRRAISPSLSPSSVLTFIQGLREANHPTDESFIALSKATSFPPVSRDMLYFGWLENEMNGTPTSPVHNWKVIHIKVSSYKLFNWFPDLAFWRSASTPPRSATEGEFEGHHRSRGSESGPAPRMQLWNHCFPQLGMCVNFQALLVVNLTLRRFSSQASYVTNTFLVQKCNRCL